MKIENKNKLLIYTIAIFFIVFIILFFIFKNNISYIKKININEFDVYSRDKFIFEIYENSIDDEIYEIKGYIYEENNENVKISSIWLVLAKDNSEALVIPTYVTYIEDNKINDVDYGWSGFVSYIDENKIQIDNDYKIYLLTEFNEQEKLVDLDLKLSEIIK